MRLFCCCGLIRTLFQIELEKLSAYGGAHRACRFAVSPVLARIDCVGATIFLFRLHHLPDDSRTKLGRRLRKKAAISKETESLKSTACFVHPVGRT
jgi:hypothetical protein